MRYLWSALVVLWITLLFPATMRADNEPNGAFDPSGGRTTVDVSVTSAPSGVYIQISVKQTDPGSKRPPTSPPRSSTPAPTPRSAPSAGESPTPSPAGDRTWSDPTGIYEQTPSGNLYYLTIPNISSQSDWASLFQQRPGQTPWALYLNGQFQGLIWIPNRTQSQPVRLGPPPATPPAPAAPPPGNGSSTDPYQVALSILGQVPLPNIQLEENPALGLVNLPGWFWVDGYGGKPFGGSQTVTIPPAVGPSVPFTQVPENDPRRQPTFFTVSVQLWPTSYDWSFGDGSTLSTQSLGQPYPAQSEIQHTYQYSSLRTPSGFPIQLSVVFAAQYQVNGGTSQALPSISHTYSATYPVQEAQALLTSR